jgi:hypothetical protein
LSLDRWDAHPSQETALPFKRRSIVPARWLLGLPLVFALGCGSHRFVPVSGTITLDGQPLADARIVFHPLPAPNSTEVEPESFGFANEKGEYFLKVSRTQKGAVVGKHRVTITCFPPGATTSDAPRPPGVPAPVNRVPSRYNTEEAGLQFEVPDGGTNKANFELVSD